MQFARKTNKRKNRIIFLSVLAAVLVLLTVVSVILYREASKVEETPAAEQTLIPIYPEEGRFNSQPLAYPSIQATDIFHVSISNQEGTYLMIRPSGSGSEAFNFYYDPDEDGGWNYYSPDILAEEDEMLYDDLHATVTGDGYDRIPMVTYLIAALRTPYFDYRVDLNSEDLEERNKQLAVYGLSADASFEDEKTLYGDYNNSSLRTIFFRYLDDDGKEQRYAIEIGGNTVTGSGYYYRVSKSVSAVKNSDGEVTDYKITYRDYIYVTRESNYFKYALVGIEAYINPVLVASGLDNDQSALYAPYITPDYRQWKTEIHKLGALPSDVDAVKKNVTDIFAQIDAYMPSYSYIDKTGVAVEKVELGEYIFNLTELSDNALYDYIASALAGKEIGQSVTQSVLYEKNVTEGTRYRYIINEVNAVITADGENTTPGAAATTSADGKHSYIRVTYKLQKYDEKTGEFKDVENITVSAEDENGDMTLEKKSAFMQGILDLKYLEKLGVSAEDIEKLSSVGDFGLASNYVTIDLTYDKKLNTGLASYKNMTYWLDAVLEIYETVRDEDGNVVSYDRVYELTDTSLVVFRYYYVSDGKTQNANVGYIDMQSNENEADHERQEKLRAKIRAWMNSDSEEALRVLEEHVYTDVISDFILYSFKNISGYVSGELISAFRFVNDSDRDPFYGESFYERSEDFMLYAVSQSACEKVVKILGGIDDSSSVGGLSGKETVKVGITPESLEKYIFRHGKEDGELHDAHIVRYSLPRERYPLGDSKDSPDDFGWYRTLDFVLYISEPIWESESSSWIRYVASELYDIIVKIDADVLGFVELDTVDFWARRNLMLIDSTYLKNFEAEFDMDELTGRYNFNLMHYSANVGSASDYDWIDVLVTNKGAESSNFITKFDEYVTYNSNRPTGDPDKEVFPSLEGLYNWLAGEPVSADTDSMGTGMFKELLRMLYFTNYMGTLTEEEQKDALTDENGKSKAPLLTLRLRLDGDNDNIKKNRTYVYDFYRCDDRRIMVRISEREGSILVGGIYASDFYITSLAFEKIVANIVGILNGETIDANNPYPDFEMP